MMECIVVVIVLLFVVGGMTFNAVFPPNNSGSGKGGLGDE